MAVHTYECLFLLDPNKASADFEGVTKAINALIERHGGEMMVTRPWGDPKLAYPIKKFRKGIYYLTYFKADAKGIPAFEDDCRLADTILRHMVLRLHPRLVDDLLAHLSGENEGGENAEGEGQGDRGGERSDRDRGPRGDRPDRGGDRRPRERAAAAPPA